MTDVYTQRLRARDEVSKMEDKKITVLLVDDEEQFRTGTARVLARRGFEVETAAGGAEALKSLEGGCPTSSCWTCGWRRWMDWTCCNGCARSTPICR